ncbi:hypothetical protein C3L33_09520, partial [Rhododendron williamsianum]
MQGMVMLCISAFHQIPEDMTGMYFVPVVLLIAVGRAGGVPILEGFLVGQLTAHEPSELDKDEGRVYARKTVWWITASLLCKLSTPWIFGHAGWRVIFICSTSVMGIGYLLFLGCIPLYHRSVDDAAAANTDLERAARWEGDTFVTASDPPPMDDSSKSTEKNQECSTVNKEGEGEEEEGEGRSLVEQWKALSVMIPMWTTFLVFGLVLSTGDAFFAEQGYLMARNKMDIYVVIMIGKIIRATSSFFTSILLKRVPKRLNTLRIIVGIWTAMVLSVFCCSVAWRVEFRRLEPGLTMNTMRLAPQYCLLGLMEGIGRQGLDLFFEVQVSGAGSPTL